MKKIRVIALAMAVIMIITMNGTDFLYAANTDMDRIGDEKHSQDDGTGSSEDNEDIDDSEEKDGTGDSDSGKDDSTDEGENVQEPECMKPSVKNLKAEFNQELRAIELCYEIEACEYVVICLNGEVQEEKWAESSYRYTELEKEKKYEFQLTPYNENGEAGDSVKAEITTPNWEARVSEADADYDEESNILSIEWDGQNIKYADIYQDAVKIAAGVQGGKWTCSTVLQPLRKYTYKIVPYNRYGEKGIEKTEELLVEDISPQVKSLEAEYNEASGQLYISWDSENTSYVKIFLNETELVSNYKKNTYTLNYVMQPGVDYTVSVIPYSAKNIEGEEEEEKFSTGIFDVPFAPSVKQKNVPEKDKKGKYTGFYKPILEVAWDAQAAASYEIYRGEKDKKNSYVWIATVKAKKSGQYIYTDNNVTIGKYYYKIRRKIAQDTYVDQEIYSALSESGGKQISVSAPKVKSVLSDEGAIALTLSSGKDYVSGYEIYKKSGSGSYQKIADISGNSYLDKDVAFDKTYCYKAKAYYYDSTAKKRFYSSYSGTSKIKNRVGTIEASIKALSENKIKISWLPAANAEGYEIYYKTDVPGDSYILLDRTNKLSVTERFGTGKSYVVMIKAYRMNQKGKTYFSSAELSFRTGFTKPQGVRIAKTTYKWNSKKRTLQQKDKISWNRVYGASGYRVEKYDAATKKYKLVAKVKKSKNTSYTVVNTVTAKAAAPIKYRISAYNEFDEVKKGESIQITPEMEKAKGVKVKKYNTGVKISWSKVNAAEKYQVYRSNGRTMVLVGETKKLSLTDTGLVMGVNYSYYVKAVNVTAGYQGILSDPAEYTILPSKASGFTANLTELGQIQLNWTAAKGAESYVIYCTTDPKSPYIKLAEVNKKTKSYIHAQIEPGYTYYYRITALSTNSMGMKVESKYTSAKITIEMPEEE